MFFEPSRKDILIIDEKDHFCPPHFHRSIEILYILEGKKMACVNGEYCHLKKGDMLLCPPYAIHTYPRGTNTKQLVYLIPSDYCPSFEKICAASAPKYYYVHDEDGRYFSYLQKLSEPVHKTALIGLVHYLFGLFMYEVDFTAKRTNPDRDLAERIANYIEENYTKKITLAEISSYFGYSRAHFSVLFHKIFQMDLPDYINTIRVIRSEIYLKTDTTAYAAFAVGFQSTQQYFLNFKKYYGCAPKEYMKLLKTKQKKKQ